MAKTHGHRWPGNDVINIPNTPGVEYQIDGKRVTGGVVVDKSVTLKAVPLKGYRLSKGATTEWRYVWKDEAPKDDKS